MVLAEIDWSNPSGTTAAISAIMPLLLGGAITVFRNYIDSRTQFRHRIGIKRTSLMDRSEVLLSSLLNHARKIGADDFLRGDGHDEPDLVHDYTAGLFRLFAVFRRLELLKLATAAAYWLLFLTTVGAVVALVASATRIGYRPYVLRYGLIALAVQVLCVLVLYFAGCRLDQYEDIT